MRASTVVLAIATMQLALAAIDAEASENDRLFRARFEIGETKNLIRGVNALESIDDLFDSRVLEDLTNSRYDPLRDPVYARLDLRGVQSRAGFDLDDATFFFQVPSIGLDIAFNGSNRDESIELFEDWIENGLPLPDSKASALTSLLQAFVAESAVDPIAGTPFSLQTRMMQAPYDLGARALFRPKDPHEPDADGEIWRGRDEFAVRTDYTPFWGGRWNGFMADLALEYTLNFEDPRFAVTFDLPLAYTQTEGDAHTATAHGGLGFLYRALPWWNILVQGRGGIAGSVELGGLAVLYSAGVTSHMQWKLGQNTFRLGNAFSASSSVDGMEWFGYEITYDITNYLIRNGVELERALSKRFLGHPLFARLDFTDSWVLGSDVFVDHYNEVGLAVGTTRSFGSGAVRDRTSLGLKYTGAQDYHALRLSLDHAF